MARPMNKDEYRAQLAEAFAHVLEEHGLEWKKEWNGRGGEERLPTTVLPEPATGAPTLFGCL